MKLTETIEYSLDRADAPYTEIGVLHLAKDSTGLTDISIHHRHEEIFHGTIEQLDLLVEMLTTFRQKAARFAALEVPKL